MRLRLAAAALMALLLALAAGASAASARPGSARTAVVSLGDSYISGEAGRWNGNSTSPTPSNAGTDRACVPTGSPLCQDRFLGSVYVEGTDRNGCHRSDVSEILSSRIRVSRRINLSCSGGKTINLRRSKSGGVGQKGEPAQGDLLAGVAGTDDVKLIIVSIVGNDLGFADIVEDCLIAYTSKTGPCRDRAKATVDRRTPAARAGLVKAIDEIRAVMRSRGYLRTDYRLVFQTYPSVVPRAAEARYPESDPRRSSDGCPLYDTDLNGARDELAPQIGRLVKSVARAKGAEILELKDLMQGHEICSKSARAATEGDTPGGDRGEWGRALGPTAIQQGQVQEVFHPNAFAQRALGDCLEGVYARPTPGTFTCTAGPGVAPTGVNLRRSSRYAKPRLRLRARAVRVRRRPRSSCFRFLVTSSQGERVRGARVRFAGHRAKTNRRGRVVLCARVRPGRHKVLTARAKYRPAKLIVRTRRR